MIKCYSLLILALMAPVMVFPAALDQDPDLSPDREHQQKETKAAVAAQDNVPSLFDLCKQELLKKGVPGSTEQEKKENTATILNLSPNLRTNLGSLFVPRLIFPSSIFPLEGKHISTLLHTQEREHDWVIINKKRDRIMLRNGKTIYVYDPRNPIVFASPLYTLNHSSQVFLVAFNQDGTRIITQDIDCSHRPVVDTLHVWDAHDGKPLYSFSNKGINDIAFNPSNKDHIIVACDDKAYICDIKEKCVVHTLQQPYKPTKATSVAYVPNSNLVATGFESHIFLWDTNTGNLSSYFYSGHCGHIKKLSSSANGSRLIISEERSGSVSIWNIHTQELVCCIRPYSYDKHVVAIALNADGSLAITGHDHGEVCIWDANTGHLLYVLPHKDGAFDLSCYINSVSFDEHNNDQIVVSTHSGVWIWDLSSLKKLAQGDVTPEQSKLLKLLSDEVEKESHHYWLRTHYYQIRNTCYEIKWFLKAFAGVIFLGRPHLHDYSLQYPCALYPLDLSILARKHNIPVQDLRKALDSFDPEVKQYIIKKYNIQTDWFYWLTRPVVLKSAAGVVLAGLTTYLGWKLFKK